MLMQREFLIMLLLCGPFIMSPAPANAGALLAKLTGGQITTLGQAKAALKEAVGNVKKDGVSESAIKSNEKKITNATTEPIDIADADVESSKLEKTKGNEQSLANRTLTAVSIAATGIGTMELLQGRAEQKADQEADQAMDALIATMHCTYGGGKQVKAGPEQIELPGGNNQELMQYRNEYFALAKDLKERKEALGMKPGIEAEEIKDKASMGLYDDENVGIENGAYASLYRAKMLGSETDQAKIKDMADTSKKRVVGGAIAAGAGVVVGVVGNSLINGKLGEKIKALKDKKESTKENDEIIQSWKQGLNKTGMKNVTKLDLSGFDMTDTKEILAGIKFEDFDLSDKDATTDIDINNGSEGLSKSLTNLFSE